MTKHFTLPRQKALDSNADPVAGAKLYFFEENTTTPLTVYSDAALSTAHGVFVEADGDGIFPPIFPPYGAFDVLMTDGTDAGNDYTQETTLYAKTSVQGDTDLTSLQNTIAFSKTEAETVAVDTTITSDDWGKAFDINPTSETITMTLPSAAATGVGNGFEVTFKHIGTANVVYIATANAETIDGMSGYCITRQQGSVTIRSDGANWKTKCDIEHDGAKRFVVTDRTLTAPPTSAAIGNIYLMPSGTLTGLWSGFSENDLVKYYGSGTYGEISKETGDLAYIVDEDLDTRWDGSTWTDFSNITAPTTSVLKTARFTHEESSGTDGGSASVVGTWTARTINTSDPDNNIPGCTLSSNQITIPAGNYLVLCTDTQRRARVYSRFKSTTTDTQLKSCANNNMTQTSNYLTSSTPVVMGTLSLDEEEVFELQYLRNAANNEGLGFALGTDPEVYAIVQIIDLESIQGPQGVEGAQGNPGADGSDGFGEIYVQASEPGSFAADQALWIRTTDGQVHISASGVMVDQSYSIKGDTGAIGAIGMDWQGAWVTSTAYALNDGVENNGSSYICTQAHTSSASDEPGTGGSWATYWDLVASKGADGAGSGDVVGPASGTDNAAARFNTTTGKLLQDSALIIDDSGNLSGIGDITLSGTVDGRDIATDGTKLDTVETNADVTDATNVEAAGAVMESDYNANTILAATSDNTPAALTVTEQTLVGRITAGNIDALTASEVRTLLNVEDGATADQSDAEIKTAYENNADTNAFTDADHAKLDSIEASADVTDEANVVAALDGATLTDLGTPATGDWILVQDASDSSNLKKAAYSTFGGSGSSLFTPIGSVTEITSSTASADFTGLSAYKVIRVHYLLAPATDADDLVLRSSTDNGSTFDNGASDYSWGVLRNTNSSATYDTDNADTGITVARPVGNGTGECVIGVITMHNFNQAEYLTVTASSGSHRNDGYMSGHVGGGTRYEATARDAFQLLFTGGNITEGYVYLEGITA